MKKAFLVTATCMGLLVCLGLVLALSAPSSVSTIRTAPRPALTRACTLDQLRTDLRAAVADAGIDTVVSLTNGSSSSCVISSWPQAVLVDGVWGNPVNVQYLPSGSAAESLATATDPRSTWTTVSPGTTVVIRMFWTNWCAAGVYGGVRIRIPVLNSAGYLEYPTGLAGPACRDPTKPSVVWVSAPSLPVPEE